MDCLLARVIEADGATGPLVPGDENHVIHDDRWFQPGALPVGAKPFPSVVDFRVLHHLQPPHLHHLRSCGHVRQPPQSGIA